MKQLKSFIQELGVLSLSLTIVFILVMGLSIAKGWTEPSSNPPAGNVSAPINTGNTTQYKDGNLVLNNLGTFATGLTVNKDLQITNGNFKVNTATKGIQFSDGTIQTTAAGSGFGAKAWVSWTNGGMFAANGISSVVASGSSATITFSTPMASISYAVVCNGWYSAPTSAPLQIATSNKTTANFTIYGAHASGGDPITSLECVVYGN